MLGFWFEYQIDAHRKADTFGLPIGFVATDVHRRKQRFDWVCWGRILFGQPNMGMKYSYDDSIIVLNDELWVIRNSERSLT